MNPHTFYWPSTQQIPALPHNCVHVFAWDLDLTPVPQDWAVLSGEETVRARHFVFPRDRDRYVRAHSGTRKILGHYSGVQAGKIFFSNNRYGKPQIEHTLPEQLQFNLTHSDGIAALAVGRGYELGVDIEIVRPIDRDVAEHHFSPRELLTLGSLPPEQWLEGFYRCWTSKEALLKGIGLGLGLPLDAFDVEVHPQRAPALLASRPPVEIAPGWLLVGLRAAAGTIGTLAVRDRTNNFTAASVRYFSFNG